MIQELANRINAAEQHMKIDRFEIAEAERQLEAFVRANPGTPVPINIVDGMLPEARDRILPRLSLNGRFPYTGAT